MLTKDAPVAPLSAYRTQCGPLGRMVRHCDAGLTLEERKAAHPLAQVGHNASQVIVGVGV
jgi:hypothetical protein